MGRPPKTQTANGKAAAIKKPSAAAAKKAAPTAAPAKARKPASKPATPMVEDDDDMEGGEEDLEKEVVRLRRVVHQLERSASDVRCAAPCIQVARA